MLVAALLPSVLRALTTIVLVAVSSWQQGEHETKRTLARRHDYKLSFKKPYFFGEGSDVLPHFDASGRALLGKDAVRVVPSVPFQAGLVSAARSLPYVEWEVELQAQIYGRSIIGSNGLAVWYTAAKQQLGHIVGGEDRWTGLGILFETHDPHGERSMAKITGVLNHGNQYLDSSNSKSMEIGSCLKDIRNTNHPFLVTMTYTDNERFEVWIDTTSGLGIAYHLCFTAHNVHLPTNYYHSITASTGEAPDDHDILSFETFQVNPPIKKTSERPTEAKKIKEGKEYHMNETTKKHILEVENKAHEILHKNDPHSQASIPDAMTTELLQYIRTTQAQIIEKLNTMDPSHIIKPSDPDSKSITNAELAAKTDELRHQIGNIAAQLSALTATLSGKTDSLGSHDVAQSMQTIQDKLHAIESSTKEQTAAFVHKVNNKENQVLLGGSDHSIFRSLFYFVMAQLVLFTVYGTWRKRGSEPEKKFI